MYSLLLGDLPGFVRWCSGWPWGRRAKDLMTSCGAQQIGALTWRGSYALIGVKDGTRLGWSHCHRGWWDGCGCGCSAMARVATWNAALVWHKGTHVSYQGRNAFQWQSRNSRSKWQVSISGLWRGECQDMFSQFLSQWKCWFVVVPKWNWFDVDMFDSTITSY